MSPDGVVDDLSISNDTVLWRAILPAWIVVNPTGGPRASTAAFKTQEVSVFIAAETTVDQVLALFPAGSRLQWFTAGDVRAADCIIVRDTNPPHPPGHALILRGDAPGERLTGSQAKRLQHRAQWL